MKTNMTQWAQNIIDAKERKNLPVLYFPLAEALGMTVTESISSSQNMAKTMKAVIDAYPDTIAAVTGMDLTVDTEAFGGTVAFSDHQVPSIAEHVVNDADDIRALEVPDIHSGRLDVFTDAVKEAAKLIPDRPVFGGMLGPFSLAANIMEVSNGLMMTLLEPDAMKELLEKTTAYLIKRAQAYKDAGANGVFLAEPTAGLLAPEQLDEFSSAYIKQLVDAVQDDTFFIILHDCGQVKDAVASMVSTGCKGHHYGNTVDMRDILPQIPPDILVFGNIDPSTAFFTGTPEEVAEKTTRLLEDMEPYPHFVLSSGCDLPLTMPRENLDAYYGACREYNARLQKSS